MKSDAQSTRPHLQPKHREGRGLSLALRGNLRPSRGKERNAQTNCRSSLIAAVPVAIAYGKRVNWARVRPGPALSCGIRLNVC